jgi:aspartate/methionine/tyrosine aminotransferase
MDINERFSRNSVYAHNVIEEDNAVTEMVQRTGAKVIEANKGDPAAFFHTPKYMIDAYIRALRERKTFYSSPLGVPELRKAISSRYRRMYGLSVGPDEIIVTQGVSEALRFINAIFINQGDRAMLFKPCYPPYIPDLMMYGGRPVYAEYEEERGWRADLDRVRRELQKQKRAPKYMLIANPNNPTGTVLNRKELSEMVGIANEFGMPLISDEIYDEIVYNGAKFTSLASVAEGVPYAILNGASKDYDATGFRIGYAVIPGQDRFSAEIRRRIGEMASTRLSPNTPAQYAVAEAIGNANEHRKAVGLMVKKIAARVNACVDAISRSKHMSASRPEGAFYVLAKVDIGRLRVKDEKEFVSRLITEEHVRVARGSGFQAPPGYIRIVALAEKRVLEEAVRRIDSFCYRNLNNKR